MALAGEAPAAYVVRFTASKVEDAFETVFAAKGAALGAVSARSETDFALSHADRATPCLLTESPRVIDVPIDDALLAAAERLHAAEFDGRAPGPETLGGASGGGGPIGCAGRSRYGKCTHGGW